MGTLLEPQSLSPDVRIRAQIAALEQRLAALERGVTLPVFTGTPGAGTGREGSLGADTANKLWLRVNGVWKSVAVA